MEAAENLVIAAVELPARVEHGENHLESGQACFFLDAHRDPPSIVGNGNRAVPVQGNGHGAAMSGQGLIHRVVYDFVDQMVESGRGRVANVHCGPFAHCLQAFQNLDLFCAVFIFHHSAHGLGLGWGGSF